MNGWIELNVSGWIETYYSHKSQEFGVHQYGFLAISIFVHNITLW
jgi:hypothetical protein